MTGCIEGRSSVVLGLLSNPAISAVLFQPLDLDEVGSKQCLLLLNEAIEYQQHGEWERCREAALKAREYAWEQLHSGPSWSSVSQVHRDAYGLAGTLVATAIFISGEPGSLDRAVYALDLVAMMAGGRFQNVANDFVDTMEKSALMTSEPPSSARSARPPSAREPKGSAPERLRRSEPCMKKAKRDSTSGEIRRIRMPPLDVFQREYMETATPVILSGVLDGWPAMGASHDWSNPSYIRSVAGRRTVPIELGGSYTGEDWRQELMTIGDFIGRFIEPKEKDEQPAESCGNSSKSGQAAGKNSQQERDADKGANLEKYNAKAYLAQHQLFDQIPALRRDIMTPDYCALLLEDEEDDRDAGSVAINAWFGPSGTVSPLHNDPFHNLLAQVVGTKRILLVNRTLSAAVYPRPGLMSNTSQVDAADPNLSEFPRFKEAMPLLECELRKGEVLYIPPLFWHHVEALSISFSVSFWWGKRRAM
ncbi:unnamed protein product [Scytosiphon promiscuus]